MAKMLDNTHATVKLGVRQSSEPLTAGVVNDAASGSPEKPRKPGPFDG